MMETECPGLDQYIMHSKGNILKSQSSSQGSDVSLVQPETTSLEGEVLHAHELDLSEVQSLQPTCQFCLEWITRARLVS